MATILISTALVTGGVAAQAAGVVNFRGEPSKESVIADSRKGPLFPANDGATPSRAQKELARRVSEILTPGVHQHDDAGVPPQFDHGIVGFTGTPATGYTVVVGKGEDVTTVVGFVLNGTSPLAEQYLTSRMADRSTTELKRAWRAVVTHKWIGKVPSYSLDLDAASGRLEITTAQEVSAADRAQLVAKTSGALTFRIANPPILGIG